MKMVFIPRTKHIYGPPQPVTEIALLFYQDGIRPSQETHLLPSSVCYAIGIVCLSVHDVRTSQETQCGPPRRINLLFSKQCFKSHYMSIFN
jgi:hypothetical protein